mmetsp:Transcript_57813/g.134641  ORF Transcript_57813/g.134641 Transcript_57813/m.134641 type:complete len:122 (+) Transcript_57813:169-534(+)
MAAVSEAYSAQTGSTGNIVFAAAARLAERAAGPLIRLLETVRGSQLLLWTGTWEPPMRRSKLDKLRAELHAAGMGDRCGCDCKVTSAAPASARIVERLLCMHDWWRLRALTSHCARALVEL